jgi:hypothetical protein
MTNRKLLAVPALTLATLLSACGGGGLSGDSEATGTLNLGITDAPVDAASRVVVEFTGVELRRSGGEPVEVTFETPRQIDLLALTGGESELLLDGLSLPAGNYQQIRLQVNAGLDASDSFIELEDGALHPLHIPSGNQAGLRTNRPFVVPAGGRADFTIDFDLRKSVVAPSGLDGTYILRPTLRLVNNVEVGTLAGTVPAALATAEACSPAVYVYSGAGVSADDVGSPTEPVTTARVELDEASGEYRYRAAFLTAGSYTAAFTCQAAADQPETDDAIEFLTSADASVTAGQTTELALGE